MYLKVNPIARLLSDTLMSAPERGARRAKFAAAPLVGKSQTDPTRSVSRQSGAKIYARDGFLEKDGVGRIFSEKI